MTERGDLFTKPWPFIVPFASRPAKAALVAKCAVTLDFSVTLDSGRPRDFSRILKPADCFGGVVGLPAVSTVMTTLFACTAPLASVEETFAVRLYKPVPLASVNTSIFWEASIMAGAPYWVDKV